MTRGELGYMPGLPARWVSRLWNGLAVKLAGSATGVRHQTPAGQPSGGLPNCKRGVAAAPSLCCCRYISRHQDLAVQYYEVLTKAVEDSGITVRKRAVRLLWECCVRCADNFPHRTDAIVRILERASDPEEAMRTLVGKICAEIWFLAKITLGEGSAGSRALAGAGAATLTGPQGKGEAPQWARPDQTRPDAYDANRVLPALRAAEDESAQASHHQRSPEQRAKALAEVCAAMYSRLGLGINVPLAATSPIVATLRSVIGDVGRAWSQRPCMPLLYSHNALAVALAGAHCLGHITLTNRRTHIHTRACAHTHAHARVCAQARRDS